MARQTRKSTKTSRAPDKIDKLVGENLRRFRLAECMTLAELGHELGISHQQLQKYETGTNRLSAGMLKRAADTLRRPVEIFYEGADEAPPVADTARQEDAEFFERLAEIGKAGARRARAGMAMPRDLPRNLQDPPIPAKAIPAGMEARA